MNIYSYAVCIVSWLTLSLIIGFLGKKKEIGLGRSLLISLVCSPLAGLIVVLFSKNKMLNFNKPGCTFTVKEQPLHLMSQVYDWLDAPHQIQLYKNLLDSGTITQQEYDKKKNELLDL